MFRWRQNTCRQYGISLLDKPENIKDTEKHRCRFLIPGKDPKANERQAKTYLLKPYRRCFFMLPSIKRVIVEKNRRDARYNHSQHIFVLYSRVPYRNLNASPKTHHKGLTVIS